MLHPLDLSWSLCRLAQIRSESVETITDVQSARLSNWTPRPTLLSWLAVTPDNVFIFYPWCHCSLNNVSFNFVSLSRLLLIPWLRCQEHGSRKTGRNDYPRQATHEPCSHSVSRLVAIHLFLLSFQLYFSSSQVLGHPQLHIHGVSKCCVKEQGQNVFSSAWVASFALLSPIISSSASFGDGNGLGSNLEVSQEMRIAKR